MTAEPERTPLRFETDRGAGRATWIAAAIAVGVIGWMGSGFLLPSGPAEAPPEARTPEPASVSVRTQQAEPVVLRLRAEGQALPDRDTPLRAEATGDVAEVLVAKGDDVAAGQPLVRLNTRRTEADLRRAEQDLATAAREFDNAESLLERGVATADRLSQARAALVAAEAGVVAARDALDASVIVAPFAGRIEELALNEGELAQTGTEIGRIVDLDPLTVAVRVPQQSVAPLRPGRTAEVAFITGERAEGTIAFVGTSADPETRTFLIEIEVPNPDGAIPAGVSASVTVPTGEALAQFVSPSVIALDEEGRIGVKTVEDGRVAFVPVEVVRAETSGVWVTGLPDEVTLITVGQGFVRDGEEVTARPEGEAGEAPPPASAEATR
jgi:multidrug efflux system membrane fusion protein